MANLVHQELYKMGNNKGKEGYGPNRSSKEQLKKGKNTKKNHTKEI